MREAIIIMADVIGSRQREGGALAQHLGALVGAANEAFGERLASPLTVTLGDEFQGVACDVPAGVELILWLEHRLRREPFPELPYQLRFVLHEGRIESPVNPDIAHGMLGPGLSEARDRLNREGRDVPRVQVSLRDEERSRRLGQLFAVLDDLVRDWKAEDYRLIEAMLESGDSEALGRQFGRHRTSIDRRRQTLKIGACRRLETLLRDLSR